MLKVKIISVANYGELEEKINDFIETINWGNEVEIKILEKYKVMVIYYAN